MRERRGKINGASSAKGGNKMHEGENVKGENGLLG